MLAASRMNTNELQKLFIAFREQCIWIRCCYNTYHTLYESNDRTKRILIDSAPIFFDDLNSILREFILLQICKITDPAETAGHKNLTVESLNIELCNHNLMTQEISDFSAGLSHYRDLVIEVRNKLIGHLDRETVLNDVPIGGHAKEDDIKFFEDLQGYNDAVGNGVDVGLLDFRTNAGSGDVFDLMKTLKHGIYRLESNR